jgi:hypothetical protein
MVKGGFRRRFGNPAITGGRTRVPSRLHPAWQSARFTLSQREEALREEAVHTKYALLPAGETSPAVDVPGVDVSSPHIGVRAGHMPVQDCHRELRRAVVDVDVRALAVCCVNSREPRAKAVGYFPQSTRYNGVEPPRTPRPPSRTVHRHEMRRLQTIGLVPCTLCGSFYLFEF